MLTALNIQRDGDDTFLRWQFNDLAQLRSAIVHCMDFGAEVRTIEPDSRLGHATAEQLRVWLAFEYITDDP